MYSPFGMKHSPLGAGLLAEAGHDLPEDGAYQSGAEDIETYLSPLAELPLLAGRVESGARSSSSVRTGWRAGDENDCLAVPPLAAATLRNPEPSFFVLGSKSHGKGGSILC